MIVSSELKDKSWRRLEVTFCSPICYTGWGCTEPPDKQKRMLYAERWELMLGQLVLMWFLALPRKFVFSMKTDLNLKQNNFRWPAPCFCHSSQWLSVQDSRIQRTHSDKLWIVEELLKEQGPGSLEELYPHPHWMRSSSLAGKEHCCQSVKLINFKQWILTALWNNVSSLYFRHTSGVSPRPVLCWCRRSFLNQIVLANYT